MPIAKPIQKTDYKGRTWSIYRGYYTLIKDEKTNINNNTIS